jgi:undecaprenyl-diphosphatase
MGERRALALHQAVALGLLHGPTELLPVSSSAHTALVPWLARWPYNELEPELRKSFEVALHTGTAVALLLRPPWERRAHGSDSSLGYSETGTTASSAREHGRFGARLGFLGAALAPPALTGYALGGRIERRLGTPATIAAGLLAGSAAMAAAEMHAKKSYPPRTRTHARGAHVLAAPTDHPPRIAAHHPHDAGTRPAASAEPRDGLVLGFAQALALIPGVSRSGATLAAARACGFSPIEADRLSWVVGLPVIAGATLLKGIQLARAGTPSTLRLPLLVGATSAFTSTLASATMLGPSRRTALWPTCAVYRAMLALLVIRRIRDKAPQGVDGRYRGGWIVNVRHKKNPPTTEGIFRPSRLKS